MFSVPENRSPGGSKDVETKQGGRPRLPENERRTIRIGVNVSPAEYATLRARADAAGMRPSVFLREAGLGTRIGAKVNDHVYHELSRIGVNVNQMARVANQTGRLPELARLHELLHTLLALRGHI